MLGSARTARLVALERSKKLDVERELGYQERDFPRIREALERAQRSLDPRLDNLMRLYRSAEKWLPEPDMRRRFRDVVSFLRDYTSREPGEVRRYLEGAAKHRTSLFLHRLGWKASGAAKVTRDSRVVSRKS